MLAIGAIGCVAIMIGAVRLNVRYNRIEPYAPLGFMVTRLVGAAGAILIFIWAAVLSLFW